MRWPKWSGKESVASSALTLPDAGCPRTSKERLERKEKQSWESWAFRRSGEGQAGNPRTSPKQLFSQPLSVSGERLAEGRKADLSGSVGKVAQPALGLYISKEKWWMSVWPHFPIPGHTRGLKGKRVVLKLVLMLILVSNLCDIRVKLPRLLGAHVALVFP